jgi:hypothetical protein
MKEAKAVPTQGIKTFFLISGQLAFTSSRADYPTLGNCRYTWEKKCHISEVCVTAA